LRASFTSCRSILAVFLERSNCPPICVVIVLTVHRILGWGRRFLELATGRLRLPASRVPKGNYNSRVPKFSFFSWAFGPKRVFRIFTDWLLQKFPCPV
jgi:hypothetical protein